MPCKEMENFRFPFSLEHARLALDCRYLEADLGQAPLPAQPSTAAGELQHSAPSRSQELAPRPPVPFIKAQGCRQRSCNLCSSSQAEIHFPAITHLPATVTCKRSQWAVVDLLVHSTVLSDAQRKHLPAGRKH